MTPYSIDDIARYAEGEMSAEEKQRFEQALAADDSLRQQLALYHDVHGSLQQHFQKDKQQEQLENTLTQMRGEFFNQQARPAKLVRINRYLRYTMGAAAVLLVTLFLWKPWQTAETDLFEQYSEIRMIDPTVRGDNADSLLQLAAIEFNSKNYFRAQSYLQLAKRVHENDSYIEFYFGVSLLNLNDTTGPRIILNKLYEGESVYKYEAAFFIALSYVKTNNKPAAREWLQKIPADAANYNKAQELLGKL